VLEWMGKIKNGNMFPIDYKGYLYNNNQAIGNWNLPKSKLSEQSQELIDALTELIPK